MGLRVLGLETGVAAPFATMLLADTGADVIKIEDPLSGDSSRAAAPFKTDADGERRSLAFLECNRNKRSVALELGTANGRETFLQLVETADIVVENLGPGAMDELGIGYGVLSARNPGLIVASISLGGDAGVLAGPNSKSKGGDVLAQALSGLMLSATGDPLYLGVPAAEVMAATLAVSGVLEAVLDRDRHGRGRHIDVSLYDAALVFQAAGLVAYRYTGQEPPVGARHPWAGRGGYSALHGTFDAIDGKVMISVPGERPWRRFCTAVGMPTLPASPTFATDAARREHDAELRVVLEGWFAARTRKEAVDALSAETVPAAPLQEVSDLLACPQLKARDMLVTIKDPAWGEIVVPGNPIKSSVRASVERRVPPALGEHTDEVLRELLDAPGGRASGREGDDAHPPSTADRSSKGPLSGIRVLALETFVAGPSATMMLADAGADVIKIEDPRSGDGARHNPPLRTAEDGEQRSLHFGNFNRNKRSLALNLKSQEGRDVFFELVRSADVVVQNLRPGLMKEFGIDYPVLVEVNPRIVVASISFCGDDDFMPGPYSGRLGTDPVAQALSGVMFRPDREPVRLGVALADCLAPAFLTVGILHALVERRASGQGRRIDVSLYDAGVASQMRAISTYSGTGEVDPPGNDAMVFPSGVFEADDGFVVLDTTWAQLSSAIGKPELAGLARQGEGPPDDALVSKGRAVIEEWLAGKSKHEAAAVLSEQGICAAPVQGLREVNVDPHLRARGMLVPIVDPAWGEVEVVGNPIKGFAAPPPPRRPPSLGGDGPEILSEVLGLGPEELEQLVKRDVIPA